MARKGEFDNGFIKRLMEMRERGDAITVTGTVWEYEDAFGPTRLLWIADASVDK